MFTRAVVFVGLLSLAWCSVVKRDTTNPCYQCPSFDATGRGFVETDDGECIAYNECWKILGTDELVGPLRRYCPIGTMLVNTDAVRGAPCGHCDPVVCPACMRDFTTIEIILDCHYIQMVPSSDFGMDDGEGGIVKVGSCGLGGYFNDSFAICTCTRMGPGCTYRVDIPLTSNIDDASCHKAWVGQTGMPAMAVISDQNPPPNMVGSACFGGYDANLGAGAHLTTYTLDGVFAGNWVFQLSVMSWFRIDDSYQTGTMGIVTLGDCAIGASVNIWIVNGRVVGGLETFINNTITKCEVTGPNVQNGQWYYAAMLYDSSLDTDNLQLYVFDVPEYNACNNDRTQCVADDTANCKGSVSPRGCGFHIASTANEVTDEYFVGCIAGVKVNQGFGIF